MGSRLPDFSSVTVVGMQYEVIQKYSTLCAPFPKTSQLFSTAHIGLWV